MLAFLSSDRLKTWLLKKRVCQVEALAGMVLRLEEGRINPVKARSRDSWHDSIQKGDWIHFAWLPKRIPLKLHHGFFQSLSFELFTI